MKIVRQLRINPNSTVLAEIYPKLGAEFNRLEESYSKQLPRKRSQKELDLYRLSCLY